MLIKQKPSWYMPEHLATPEDVYFNRRQILKSMGGAVGIGAAAGVGIVPSLASAAIEGFPAPRNAKYTLDRAITDEEEATTYTNFYEFGSSKNIWRWAKRLKTDPWEVVIDGMVEEDITIQADALIRKLGDQEERLYRHRCVEAWAMAVPWTGVPLANLVKFAKPTAGAKYMQFETFLNPDIAPGQRASWSPWPYTEGLTIEEASSTLPLLATGLYGKAMPNQNGAPIRLVVPWKYGFKCIKSIVRITFTDKQPVSYWQELQGREYGFWANVNPDVPHPRWSQATERLLGTGERVPTQLYNGYAEECAHLYANMPQDRTLFF